MALNGMQKGAVQTARSRALDANDTRLPRDQMNTPLDKRISKRGMSSEATGMA
ncbi:hypothetical protein LTR70_010416, partial [Exophiala xenobiotica]